MLLLVFQAKIMDTITQIDYINTGLSASESDEFLPMDTSLLISADFGDITKGYIEWEPGEIETINYYISDLTLDSRLIDSTPFTAGHELFIDYTIETLDPLIDLDFQEADSIIGADIIIISTDRNIWFDDGDVGYALNADRLDKWFVFCNDNTGNESDDLNTIVHELGHSIGLSHPGEQPRNPDYNTVEYTVMSYLPLDGQFGYVFTSNDIDALQQIWGTENDASIA